MTDKDDIKHLWRNQNVENTPMGLSDIHARARKFNARRQRGNAVEYAACVVVVVIFSAYFVLAQDWMTKAGHALVILATPFVAWQLHRRGPRRLPNQDDGVSIFAFHRAELVRSRDMLRSSWLWYIAPPLPGVVLIMLGGLFQHHVPGRTIAPDYLKMALGAGIAVLTMMLVAVFNMLRAHWVQKKIDEMDAWQSERDG